jgi:peptidoglycan/LPS O-acetylase OafA/YrhL
MTSIDPSPKRFSVDRLSFIGDSIVRAAVYLLAEMLFTYAFVLLCLHDQRGSVSLPVVIGLALPFAVVNGFRARGAFVRPFFGRSPRTFGQLVFDTLLAAFTLIMPGRRHVAEPSSNGAKPFRWTTAVADTIGFATLLFPMYGVSMVCGASRPGEWPWEAIVVCLGAGFAYARSNQRGRPPLPAFRSATSGTSR